MNNTTAPHRTGYIDARVFEREYSLSTRLFFLWIKQGRLAAYRPSSRKTLVRRDDVERLLEQSKSKAGDVLDRIVNEIVGDVIGT
jgi:hypothetical protein